MEYLSNFKEFKIPEHELLFINGQTDLVDYCRTLDMIVRNNDLSDAALLAARHAAGMYCGPIL